ncbi:Hpt domain-containing protein [Sphingobacterium sp. lm-10]|uniref:Hpt domain-containing protein n=1 Tax=Sphingobacterium sp. lm-10 TaxID=2944904 RepID=UPI0020218FAA|nr:Hpt domain-containing protein [Sphingobacterium sp. lm-10]MCL7987893.1 Hpt domain-containing protein [Sphingobacterium sp. lm-10]
MNSYTYIKPEMIKTNMLGDEQMIKTFIGMYLTHCQTDFSNLSQAIDQKDLAAIASKAHHIKPTMAYIGANDLHVQFHELESSARTGVKLAVIMPIFQTLKINFHAMMQELDHFYNTLA